MSTSIIPHINLETETLRNGELDVIKLTGREAISQLFQYEILAVCRDPSAVEPEELVGQEAALVYSRDGKTLGRVYGMISVVNDRLETEVAYSTYRLTFVPRAYRLTLVETLDVFLDLNVPDVLRSKLKDAGFRERGPSEVPPEGGSASLPLGEGKDGFDFELRLYESYPVRDFIVQYKETDLAFLSRLCEHVGISFFFEHSGGRDVLVFTDVNEGFRHSEAGEGVPYRGRGEHTDVYSFEETIRMIPAQYVVRDYNYRTPQVTLTGQAQAPIGLGAVVEYGSHVKTPDEAEKLAHVRAQERMAQRRVYQAKSDVPLLTAGSRLAVLGHPRGDTKLLVTEVAITAEQVTLGVASVAEAFFGADFKAIGETRRYRPPRITPKPRIHGVVNGVIDSANDDHRYADVDDQGRYRVRFLFDTTGPEKGQASKLVRMAQPHVGEGFGMHFPLRAGVEVIITFVDGDPDRPIIASAVPNPQTASPVVSGNAPRNVIRTGAGNEINIDDTHDSTRIKMTVPHKNTTFQLGAPNSPEGGAMLETAGASSTVATSGIAGFTSIKSGISALGEMKKGGWISSVAEKPKWFVTAGSVAEIMAAGIETASSVFEMAMSAWEANIDRLKVDSIKAQVDAQKAAEKAKASRTDATTTKLGPVQTPVAAAAAPYDAAVDDAVVNSNTPYGQAEKALRARYAPGTDAYKKAEADLLAQSGMSASKDATLAAARTSAEASMVDADVVGGTSAYGIAEKQLRQTTPVGSPGYAAAEAALLAQPGMADSKTDAVTEATEHVNAAKEASELNEKINRYKEAQEQYEAVQLSLRTNQEFLRDAKKGEKTGTYTAETETYEQAVAADQARMTAAQNELNAAKGDLDTALTPSPAVPALAGHTADQTAFKGAVDQSATDDADSDNKWNKADAAKKTYDTAVEDKETGDGAQGVAWTQKALGFLKIGVSLFSEVMSAIALADELKEKVEEMGKKLDTVDAIANSLPRNAVDAFAPRTPGLGGNVIFPIRHTLGSEGDTEVYAEKNLFLHADKTTLLGEDTLVLSTFEQLALLSQEKAELAAREQVRLTSTEIDIQADHEITISAVPLNATTPPYKDHPPRPPKIGVPNRNEGKLTAEAEDKLTIESTGGNIEIKATANKKAAAPPAQKIEIAAGGSLELRAPKIVLDAVQKADLLASDWGVRATDTSAALGSSAGWKLEIKDKSVKLGVANAPQLEITDQQTNLTGGAMKIAGDPITIQARTVDFGDATINTENLMVKGGPGVGYMSVKAKLTAAQSAAAAAQSAADTAQQAADRAQQTADTADAAAKEAQRTANKTKEKAAETAIEVSKIKLALI